MPRSSRSPSGGLAARTGWIGSIARFWQVCSPFSPPNRIFTDIDIENLCAGLFGLCAAADGILLSTSSVTKAEPALIIETDPILRRALPPNVLYK
jgi:hypothetical protein